MLLLYRDIKSCLRYFSVIPRLDPPIKSEDEIQYQKFLGKELDYPVKPDNDNH